MDRHAVATAILSVSTPSVHLGDGGDRRAMPAVREQYAAEVVRGRPERFGFFATVPLPDVDSALDGVTCAFDALGADGVVLLANNRGTISATQAFDPLFDELNGVRGRLLTLGIARSSIPLGGIPPYIADFLLDTTRAAINLARSGTLDRCPDVKIILSHAGGFIPYAAHRVAVAASGKDDAKHGLSLLQRYYFDIALSGSPSALPSLLAFAQPNHVLFGSDWPYAPDFAVAAFTAMYERYDLDDATRTSIDRRTAEQLFPRLATT
jgi:predicted TIM-barrel fold metal-dependent hydrolase